MCLESVSYAYAELQSWKVTVLVILVTGSPSLTRAKYCLNELLQA